MVGGSVGHSGFMCSVDAVCVVSVWVSNIVLELCQDLCSAALLPSLVATATRASSLAMSLGGAEP